MVCLLITLAVGHTYCKPRNSEKETTNNQTKAEMKESIMTFRSAGNFVEVTFSLSAAVYQLPVDGENFLSSMEVVAKAYRDNTPVTYEAEGTTLVKISAE